MSSSEYEDSDAEDEGEDNGTLLSHMKRGHGGQSKEEQLYGVFFEEDMVEEARE